MLRQALVFSQLNFDIELSLSQYYCFIKSLFHCLFSKTSMGFFYHYWNDKPTHKEQDNLDHIDNLPQQHQSCIQFPGTKDEQKISNYDNNQPNSNSVGSNSGRIEDNSNNIEYYIYYSPDQHPSFLICTSTATLVNVTHLDL